MRFYQSVSDVVIEGSGETDPMRDIQAQVLFYPCTIPAPLPSVHYTALFSIHAALRLHNMPCQIFSTHKKGVRGGSFEREVSDYSKFLRVKRRMLDVFLGVREGLYWKMGVGIAVGWRGALMIG
jgi:hypothetical protein